MAEVNLFGTPAIAVPDRKLLTVKSVKPMYEHLLAEAPETPIVLVMNGVQYWLGRVEITRHRHFTVPRNAWAPQFATADIDLKTLEKDYVLAETPALILGAHPRKP